MVYPIVWKIVWLIVSAVLSAALAPKPPKPKAATLDDFDLPTAEEGRPIPVVFGTVRITGANVLWYGALKAKAMRKKSLFSSTTIGYKYYLGYHCGICHGPVDAVVRIEAGEKIAWSGSVTASGTIDVDQPKLFGGSKREGGLVGAFDVCFGEPTQTPNVFLTDQIGTPQPAYRGVLGFVWRSLYYPETTDPLGDPIPAGGYVGTTPYVKNVAFTVRRISAGWSGGTAWYAAKSAIGDAMNPAHIVYQALTDPEWGMGLPVDKLDDASFADCADQLYDEAFGLSLAWHQQATVEEFISEIMDHVAGALGFDRQTGKYRMVLIRGDYDPALLPTYGPETFTSLKSYQRQGWGETVNEVSITYTDPSSRKLTGVTVHDLANVRAQGTRVSETIEFKGITSAAIAQIVATRELSARSTPIAKVSLGASRDLWAIKAANVFKFTWPERGIDSMIVRVGAIRQGTLDAGEMEIDCVEDIFGIALSVYTEQQAIAAGPTEPTYDNADATDGPSVISTATTAPPADNRDGDTYLVPAGATGAWAGHGGELAVWDTEEAAWSFSVVSPGTVITDESTGDQVQVSGSGVVAYEPLLAAGAIAFKSDITPPALSADQNDYNPTGLADAAVLRLSASGAHHNLTGLAGGADGRLMLIHNIGATYNLVLKDEDASSSAANRFALNADVTILPDQSVLLQYDSTSPRWRVIGGSGAVSPTVAEGDIIVRGSSADQRLAIGANGQVLTVDTSAGGKTKWATPPTRIVGAAFISSTTALTTAVDPVSIAFNSAYTIRRVTIIGDQSGSCTVAIKKTTLGSYTGPASGSSIVASDPPQISSSYTLDKTTFTGWTLTVAAGDVLTFSLSATSSFKRLVVQLHLEETP